MDLEERYELFKKLALNYAENDHIIHMTYNMCYVIRSKFKDYIEKKQYDWYLICLCVYDILRFYYQKKMIISIDFYLYGFDLKSIEENTLSYRFKNFKKMSKTIVKLVQQIQNSLVEEYIYSKHNYSVHKIMNEMKSNTVIDKCRKEIYKIFSDIVNKIYNYIDTQIVRKYDIDKLQKYIDEGKEKEAKEKEEHILLCQKNKDEMMIFHDFALFCLSEYFYEEIVNKSILTEWIITEKVKKLLTMYLILVRLNDDYITLRQHLGLINRRINIDFAYTMSLDEYIKYEVELLNLFNHDLKYLYFVDKYMESYSVNK